MVPTAIALVPCAFAVVPYARFLYQFTNQRKIAVPLQERSSRTADTNQNKKSTKQLSFHSIKAVKSLQDNFNTEKYHSLKCKLQNKILATKDSHY